MCPQGHTDRKERLMKIKETVKRLGLEDKTVYTLAELELIAKEANCTLHAVMKYLRNR